MNLLPTLELQEP